MRQEVEGSHEDDGEDTSLPVQFESSASFTDEGHVLVGDNDAGCGLSCFLIEEELRLGQRESDQSGED